MTIFHNTALTKLLAPCPVCKTSESLDLEYRERQFGGESYRVLCTCGVTGPERWSAEKAIAAWNLAADKELATSLGCDCMTSTPERAKVTNPTRAPQFQFSKLQTAKRPEQSEPATSTSNPKE